MILLVSSQVSDCLFVRGRAVGRAVMRSCGPTPLLYIYFVSNGNKICFTLLRYYFI